MWYHINSKEMIRMLVWIFHRIIGYIVWVYYILDKIKWTLL